MPQSEQPELMYKYMSTKAAAAVLENKTIRFSCPELFNDPSEFMVDATEMMHKAIHETPNFLGTSFQKLKTEDPVRYKKYLDYVNNAEEKERCITASILIGQSGLQEIFRPIGIACFSERCDSHLLWSFYAENGKGICLGFNPGSAFLTTTKHSKAELSGSYKVNYADKMPVPDGETIESRVLKIATTKGLDWAYEQEWQCFCKLNTGESIRYIQFEPNDVAEIIIGPRCDRNFIAAVLRCARTEFPSARVLLAHFDTGYYRIITTKMWTDEPFINLVNITRDFKEGPVTEYLRSE